MAVKVRWVISGDVSHEFPVSINIGRIKRSIPVNVPYTDHKLKSAHVSWIKKESLYILLQFPDLFQDNLLDTEKIIKY